jgi:hypothetical protein
MCGDICTLGGYESVEPGIRLIHNLVPEHNHLVDENVPVGALQHARKVFWAVVGLAHAQCKVSTLLQGKSEGAASLLVPPLKARLWPG